MAAPQPSLRISLLHATHAAGDAAVAVRARWFELAARPDLAEHLFAFDEDDQISASTPEIVESGGLPSLGGRVTAVRNWNSAAARSIGELLVVVADDLEPTTPAWDEVLRSLCKSLDPLKVAFAMRVRDSARPSDHLMRHPIVSRSYWNRFGLFDAGYFGIGADNEFTLVAHCHGLVLDTPGLVFVHRHPNSDAEPTTSHRKMSGELERTFGKERFEKRWPTWKRRLWFRYFEPRRAQRKVSDVRRRARGAGVRLGWLRALVPPHARRWWRAKNAGRAT